MTGSGSAGTASATRPACSTASSPRGTTATSKDLTRHLVSPLVFAHIRASTGGAIQQTNCHPFRHGRWLWMHNGLIREFATVKRDLAFAVDPVALPRDRGLDRLGAVLLPRAHVRPRGRPAGGGRAGGRLHRGDGSAPRRRASDPDDGGDDRRREHVGVPLLQRGQLPVAVLQHRSSTRCAREYPDNPVLQMLSDETRIVVSEPLGDLAGAWNEVPESTLRRRPGRTGRAATVHAAARVMRPLRY